MSRYSDLIKVEREFNYSINIQFDMENDRQLLRFIPNSTTIQLFKEFFIDITKDNPVNHSRILYGSYGTGKSHFLTVLSILLEKRFVNSIAYQRFLQRIKAQDEGLAYDIDSYVSNHERKPLLTVPIVFDFEDFNRCIYFSLRKRLEQIGKRVSFRTFFDQALGLIEQWNSKEESRRSLERACDRLDLKVDDVVGMLEHLDSNSETVFQAIFSDMTYGVKYIYEATNVSDAIRQANNEIADNYSGIVFIFDEFGRYIEDNLKQIKVKSVQDLAEFCDHGDGDNHIILVSHKEISQYTQRVSRSIANEWKKVEGRFKATPINDKQDQCLSLIKSILAKDDGTWDSFKKKFRCQLDSIAADTVDFQEILTDSYIDDNPIEAGYPLHPISLFVLDRLSKKVAQNERTFFTYLASQDEHSLYSFLGSHDLEEFSFVGLDDIFDYFEESIKSVQSDESFDWYKKLQSALSKIRMSPDSRSPMVRILKAIAVIGIVNASSILSPNKKSLVSAIDCPKEDLLNAIDALSEKRVIKYSRVYDRFDFFDASSFDVENMVEEGTRSIRDDVVVQILNDEFLNFALYPYSYNREYCIKRVFVPYYATMPELEKKAFVTKLGKYYDGALIMLMADNNTTPEEIIAKSRAIPRAIIFVNSSTEELQKDVKKYSSICYLESQKSKYISMDPAFENELQYFKNELRASILSRINNWKAFKDDSAYIVSCGEEVAVSAFSELSEIASRIMQKNFPNTLIVNNELINKNSISASITNAKKNAITNIVHGASEAEFYKTPYLSPDYISVRSVLFSNGFIQTEESHKENSRLDGSRPQLAVKERINDFIREAGEGIVECGELISTLKSPPFGLRNGYLSLLLAHFLAPYQKNLIVSSHSVEQEISADLFEEMVRRPNDYNFTIVRWEQGESDYLDLLESLYEKNINKATLVKNRLKAIYEGMLAHYKSIPKFARTTQQFVDDDVKSYRKLMEKPCSMYYHFLFGEIKNTWGGFDSAIEALKNIKASLERVAYSLAEQLSASLISTFELDTVSSIADALKQMYSSEWRAKRNKSFDYYTNAFLDFVAKIPSDDESYRLIVDLSRTITGLELQYWNDSHIDEFNRIIRQIKDKLDSYSIKEQLSENETMLTSKFSDGNARSFVFERSDLSPLGKSLKNKIESSISNYGLAITYEEKIQVLLSLLDDIMGRD